MPTVLILANETIAGKALLDRIRERSEEGARFFVVVPQSRPRHGNVIYDEVVRDSAQVRVDLAVEFIRDLGAAASARSAMPTRSTPPWTRRARSRSTRSSSRRCPRPPPAGCGAI